MLRLNIAKLRAPTPTLVRAFGWKMLAQSLKLVEIAAILGALGLPVTPGLILATMAALGISSTAFFVVPQGLGVNEGSVVAAFSALGLGAPQALAVGLIRRGRMLLWSAIGVGIQSLGGPGKSHTRQPEPSWGPRPSERATS